MARFSKNRLFSRLVKQFNEDLTIKTEGLEASTRNSISGSLDSSAVTSLISANSTPGVTLNTTLDSLGDTSGLDIGTLKYISEANRLFVWSGSAWETISLTNDVPTFDSDGLADSSYSLARDGTPTIINLSATDPEGVPLAWSYAVTSGTLGNTATILQDSSEFTITPSTDENDDGQFQITFSGSDGKNTITSVANFSLTFPVTPGEIEYVNTSTTFTVPAGVYNISVVCVGAGGGGNTGGISNTNSGLGGNTTFGIPSDSFYFGAGGGRNGSGTTGGYGGSRIGAYDGGGNGGSGSNGSLNSGGGGAGGYSGNGGSSVNCSSSVGGPGGGVGLYGQGINGKVPEYVVTGTANAGSGGGGGAGGCMNNYSYSQRTWGWTGSGGQNAPNNINYENQSVDWGAGSQSSGGGGGGGGGALAYKNNISVTPGQQITVVTGYPGGGGGNRSGYGAIRIVWPAYDAANGLTRAFPSTNVGRSSDIIP